MTLYPTQEQMSAESRVLCNAARADGLLLHASPRACWRADLAATVATRAEARALGEDAGLPACRDCDALAALLLVVTITGLNAIQGRDLAVPRLTSDAIGYLSDVRASC